MSKTKIFCKNCGSDFEICIPCEKMRGRIFAWRQEFCSIKCFKNFLENGGEKMRIHTNGKSYTIGEYDFAKGNYITTNGIKMKQKDIQTFILSQDELQELKMLTVERKLTRAKITNKEEE